MATPSGSINFALVADPLIAPVPPPAKVEIVLGVNAVSGAVPVPSSEIASSKLPLGSLRSTQPCRLPGAVGWNCTSTVHVPEVTFGQLVPPGTSVKSRFGAPSVSTETLPSVTPDGTLMLNVCVPGALKISFAGVAVICDCA